MAINLPAFQDSGHEKTGHVPDTDLDVSQKLFGFSDERNLRDGL
jgi:hypothetical protein